MRPRVLIVDGSNLFYRAYFSHSSLNSKALRVSGIYGSLNIVASLLRKFDCKRIIICWDGKRDKQRMELLPIYKEKRKKINLDKEDLNNQRILTQQCLEYLGIPQTKNNKEADDLIYFLNKKYNKRHQVILVSTDKDFEQLVSERTAIWNDKLGKMLTYKNFQRIKGYKPKQSVSYLCMLGDKSDNIPGIKGIGEVKAKQLLKQYKNIDKFIKSKEEPPFKLQLTKKEMRAIYTRNRFMIDLKLFNETYNTDLAIEYYSSLTPKLRIKRFFKVCDRLKFRVFKEEKFLKAFKNYHG